MTSVATVIDLVPGAVGVLGEPTAPSWAPREGTLPCASFPISRQGLERAQLLKVTATREVFLNPIPLNPSTTRLNVDGTTYAVKDSREWPQVTVVLAEEVN
ncbi:hypothetical protein DKM44_12835 [Deinococcus irradiatisoli]|uniref:Head-tail adaptor protein n=2 Tax=Deinococcus irradiatisoli TaxID=2202254 RepID=A0A2Z3JFP2_9DEIO|nr:hypothetical protein DKM44_12835 [Deinococcus irradiatisoli]